MHKISKNKKITVKVKMNMKMPNFNVKDLMREAGSTISTQVSRVVQVITDISNFHVFLILICCLFVFKAYGREISLDS